MPNTSATGGVLTQTSGPTEGITFRHFLQTIIVGVTGIANTLVRPRWQQNPPPIPSINVNWLAFGISSRRQDANSYVLAATAKTTLIRHEELDIMCSFYGPDCLDYSGRLIDGMHISQNRESMMLAGVGLVGFSDTTHIPELVNDRYIERADVVMTIKREIRRDYQVLTFLAANGTIVAESGLATISISFKA
jgi:hypothetical protein